MDDLVRWLSACLDTDAAVARTALADRNGVWTYVETPGGDHRVLDSLGYSVVEYPAVESEPWFTLPHVAVWDPARVLREINAKRQIIALHEPGEMNDVDGDVCMVCEDPDRGDEGPFYPCRTLRLLALPYADRPGYREEWRP